jgi:Cu/Ag efflux protein CusF
MTTFPRRNDGEVLTAGQLNSYLDEIEQTEAELAAHATNVFNPHNTTKSQVGLGNVDNTSDLNKPISTATQTALNGKANTSHTHVAANITDLNTAIGTHADVAASTAVRHSHSNSAVLAATTASFTTADRTKLDGIAAGADVTTSNSIDAAGGVLNSDTSTSAMQFVIDEDSMVSNLATKVPTQQSVKAYVDTAVTGIVGGEPAPHTHDDRYYTEAETTTLLSGKADTAHTHSITDTTGLQAALDAKAATTHDHHVDYIWGSSWLVGTSTRIRVPTIASGGKNYIALAAEGNTGDLGVNDTVARGDHVHDARYYTEAETNTLLSGKANTSHTHTAANITDFSTAADARITAQKGAANGLATLGADSKIPTSQIPALSLTDVYTVASQAAQLALTAQEGDVAVRTDTGLTFIHNGGTAGTMADWTQISASSDVTSVNGQTGIVVLGKTDVGLGNVDNTADVDKPISTVAQAALDAKANTSHTHVATTDLTATGTKSSSTYLRGDNTWATPPNTTYSTITQAEAENASSTTARVVTGQRLAQAVAFHAPVKVADLANYAPVSHAHTATDVTDFAETVRDTIGTALVAGPNVTITPDDVNNTITISASGGSAGPHSHVAADITDFATAVAAHTDVAANTAARHTHSNAAILNATTASFTTADETKLDGIAAGAEVNVQSDWNAVSGDAMILNKPTSMTPTAHTHTAANITDFQTQVSANTDVVANTAVRHTHSNKTTLDAITAAYTTAEQTKLAGIAAGAEVNVQSDWNAASGDAQILNKPATMPPSAHTHAAADTTTGIFDIARIPTGTTSTTVALGNHTHSGYAASVHTHAATDITGTLTVAQGGTGRATATTAYGLIAAGTTATGAQQTIAPGTAGQFLKSAGAAALASFATMTKADVGLSNVDNTSDASKPISTATQTALDGKANTSHTHVAADVTDFQAAVSANAAVAANTAARHTHANSAVLNATTASYTTAEQTKLSGIATGAEVNVQSDWNAVSGDAQILNKPTSMTPTAHTHVATTDLTATGTKSSATYLRGDNTWAVPPDTNTTYAALSQAQAESATDTTAGLATGQRIAQAILVNNAVTAATNSLSRIKEGFFNVKDYGAIGDGVSHPLSAFYGTLAAAQAVYPHATALTDEIDWAAAQAAHNAMAGTAGTDGGGNLFFPYGNYRINKTINITKSGVRVMGAGGFSVVLTGTSALTGPMFRFASTNQIIRGVGMHNMRIDLTSTTNVTGIIFDTPYDNNHMSNVMVHGIGGTGIGIQIIKSISNAVMDVGEGFNFDNVMVWGRAGFTGRAWDMTLLNEAVFNNCKGLTAGVGFYVDGCKGLTFLNCSVATVTTGWRVTSVTNDSIGITIDTPTVEGATDTLDADGNATYRVNRLTIRSIRPEGTAGPIRLDSCTLCDIDAGALTVVEASTCVQTHIRSAYRGGVTASGANSYVMEYPNGINVYGSVSPGLEVLGGNILMAGTWNGPHLVMNGWHFWVSASAQFRKKAGAPTSDGDGALV